jgi:hypothetical protein
MNTSANIFLYFIILMIGAAIGGLIERALKRRPSARPTPPTTKNNLAEDNDVEIFSAWRTGGNKVWLEMDGKRLDNKEALQPEQRQRLVSLVLDLRPWLETTRPAASGQGTAPEPIQSAAPEPEVAAQPVQAAAPEAAVAAQPVQTKNNQGNLAGEENPPVPVLDSIIEQINKVLQDKLATSMFKDRDIRLIEGPGGIVIIKDGLNRYEGIEKIPDPQVKAFIQQAVTDWEKGAK